MDGDRQGKGVGGEEGDWQRIVMQQNEGVGGRGRLWR